jgi:hypothetical protein
MDVFPSLWGEGNEDIFRKNELCVTRRNPAGKQVAFNERGPTNTGHQR